MCASIDQASSRSRPLAGAGAFAQVVRGRRLSVSQLLFQRRQSGMRRFDLRLRLLDLPFNLRHLGARGFSRPDVLGDSRGHGR